MDGVNTLAAGILAVFSLHMPCPGYLFSTRSLQAISVRPATKTLVYRHHSGHGTRARGIEPNSPPVTDITCLRHAAHRQHPIRCIRGGVRWDSRDSDPASSSHGTGATGRITERVHAKVVESPGIRWRIVETMSPAPVRSAFAQQPYVA